MSFFEELKRRNVIKVAIAYIVVAWLAAQVAEFATQNFGAPDWVIKVFVVFLILGLPFVVIGAWAFELTPEGIKREKDVDRSQSITGQTGQKLNRVVIGVLAVAVVYLLVDKLVLQKGAGPSSVPQSVQNQASHDQDAPETPSAADKSIAVLPFVNMSADADNEYFSDGISEELLNVLAKISSLHVASRTSAFAFKGKEMSIGEIAQQLQVNHILEGSVRKAGNRVRITAQLIEAGTDRHLWSESYERELDDIFEIQAEISDAIVNELKVALNLDEQQAVARAQRPTDNTEAFELYLQGRYLWRQRKEENIRAAIDLFDQAVALDPAFATAYEALAAAWGSLSAWSDLTGQESLSRAVPYARRALELDPMLSEARAIIAENFANQHRWKEMYEEYELARSNAPNNSTVMQWFAEIQHNVGYLDQALESALAAYELDPTSPVLNNVILYIAISAQEGELALKHWKIASDLGVSVFANNNVIPLLLARGDIDRIIELNGWQADEVPTCIRARKDPGLKPQLLEELRGRDPNDPNVIPRILATCLAYAGDIDAAIDIYEPIVLDRDWYAFNDFWNHQEEAIEMRRSDRFKQLVRKMGLDAFWREHGWPDLCRPVGEVDFECQ